MDEIQKKNICDILSSSAPDLREALDVHFRDLNFGEPTPVDYQLLDSTISTIHEGIWTSNESELDYDKVKSEVYKALIDERKARAEDPENYVEEDGTVDRDRAIIDFAFNWLRCLLQ